MSDAIDVEDLVDRRAWDEVQGLDDAGLGAFVVGVLDAYLADSPIVHTDRLRSLGVTMARWDRPVAPLVLAWLAPDPRSERFVAAATVLTGLWQFGAAPPAEVEGQARRLIGCLPRPAGAGPALVLVDALSAVLARPGASPTFAAEAETAVEAAATSLPAEQAVVIRARLRTGSA